MILSASTHVYEVFIYLFNISQTSCKHLVTSKLQMLISILVIVTPYLEAPPH